MARHGREVDRPREGDRDGGWMLKPSSVLSTATSAQSGGIRRAVRHRQVHPQPGELRPVVRRQGIRGKELPHGGGERCSRQDEREREERKRRTDDCGHGKPLFSPRERGCRGDATPRLNRSQPWGLERQTFVQLVLRVDDLDRQEEDRDHVEDEAQNGARLVRDSHLALRLDDPLERAVPRDERRHDHEPAECDGEERDTRAHVDARRVPQLAVDLVVPDAVVDAERDERPQEHEKRTAVLHRGRADTNLLSHDSLPLDRRGRLRRHVEHHPVSHRESR